MRFIKATYHLETKTVEYEAGDGTRLLKTAGTLNWRFNNPGNIMALPDASKQKGRIGAGTVYNPKENTFAIFSSIEAGEREKCALLRRKYRNDTISEMMSQYAPETAGNDPVAYANFISSESGVAKDKKISDLNDKEFGKVVDAISKKEGGLKAGTEKWVYVTNLTVSDGSRPIANVPFKVTLGSTSYEWKTDVYGKLKTIIHTKQGMVIVVKYTNSAGKEDVVYSAVAGDETKNILLTRNFSQFSAKTLAETPKVPREKSALKPIDYIVMPGDSLSKIAKRYKTSTDEIAKNNNIKDVSKIFPGQHLTIYGAKTNSPLIYIVVPGDTLAKIAAQYGVTVDELARWNNIVDLNKIYPGQSILISNDANCSKGSSPVLVSDKQAPKPQPPVSRTSPNVQSVNLDKKTLESVGSKKSDKPIALLPHDQREAPWMAIAIREVTEWHGTGEKKITDNYHNLTGSKGSLGSTAWCASFANYCLKETGYDYSRSFTKSSQFPVYDKTKFIEIKNPVYGALMVFRTYVESSDEFTGNGHVTFVYGKTSNGDIAGLGGNQGGKAYGGGTIKLSMYSTTKPTSRFSMTVRKKRKLLCIKNFINIIYLSRIKNIIQKIQRNYL
ncbi:TPA: LysM peptidoglycan-binding domain-containing protein [Klebsiella pneumoniae]|uniref:LysM peptidoglycan-binding domain-containing protein n=2 Tax=Klebsiella pneumoniae TaxID=573 RepID=UPI00027CD92A|nr:LysM peptidoglycan-binding domain-containing protein [Klebsiella pneumoniae]AFQ66123.1 putative LysM domain protein [Klebsiella pneumoniae subsp. pneumoniae 1084]MDH8303295.1 LysM peptidoglycan-binding domain-containing protein [Klebsiella pneumoniae]MEC5512669.1 LysM peptidoglycan-binding domain-containing protein [Klebsiella pneumoniae]MEC5603796.1 LysM peptidoglycan-binding domain-containing protein [Klebsiella pneumoniae]